MQEIADNVFIEQNSLGLFAGIVHNDEGTILIDSPIRTDGGWYLAWSDRSIDHRTPALYGRSGQQL